MEKVCHSSRNQLWSASTHLAQSMVRDYVFNVQHKEDASQEVLLGLWEATLSWQADVHSSFEQYAWYVMRRKLYAYLTEKADDKPKLSRKERELMKSLRNYLTQGQMVSSALIASMSLESGITAFRLQQIITYWYSSQCAISAQVLNAYEEASVEMDVGVFDAHDDAMLSDALSELPERDRLIIASRYLEDPRWTLSRLAEKLNLSIERVRVLEGNALKKLRTMMGSSRD